MADAQRRRQREHLSSKYPKKAVLHLKQTFDDYDADKSGFIDRHELKAALEAQKKEAQRPRFDGRCESLAERQARAGWVPGMNLDEAHDGVFLVNFTDSLFRTLDLNGDSKVEFEEVLKVMYPLATDQERRTMLTWATPPTASAGPSEEDQAKAEATEREADFRLMFNTYDKNGDGRISAKEFKAGLRSGGWTDEELHEMFTNADTSSDGWIDYDEFTVMMR